MGLRQVTDLLLVSACSRHTHASSEWTRPYNLPRGRTGPATAQPLALPAWQHPAILDLFAEGFVPKEIKQDYDAEVRGFANLLESIELTIQGLEQLDKEYR